MLANRLIERKNTILHHQMVKKDCPILYFFLLLGKKKRYFYSDLNLAYDSLYCNRFMFGDFLCGILSGKFKKID